jgi:hypothetical protein
MMNPTKTTYGAPAPEVVVKYAFGEYGTTEDHKDTFSASFWNPR